MTTPTTSRMRRLRVGRVHAALGLFAGVVLYAVLAGRHLDRVNTDAKLGAAPFVGTWTWRFGWRSAIAIVVAMVAVVALPIAVRRTRLVVTVGLSAAFAVGFGWALAIVDGWSAVIDPVTNPTEYWAGVRLARPFHQYLDTYIERGLFSSVHVRGHPPGMMLLLITMRALHLGSAWAAASLSLLGIGLTVVAVSVAVHRLSGPDMARRAAPLLAVVPFALWQVTSADAFFCALTACAVALGVLAVTARTRSWIPYGLASGIVLALALHLTYGAVTLAPMFVGLIIVGRNRRWLVPFAIGCGLVFLTFRAGGFWWFDGLRATRHHYWQGTAKFRPAGYFMAANLAVLGLAVGVPTVGALAKLPRPSAQHRWVVLPLSALASVALANFSQMSKGETERIWLLFMPWLVIAGAACVASARSLRGWLAVQAGAAILLQSGLVSKW